MSKHVFKCVLCGLRFTTEGRPSKCPSCGGRAFVHEEGERLRCKKGGCTGSCAGCSGCGH